MAESRRLFGPTVEELNAQLKAGQADFMDRAAQLGPDYAAGAGVGSLLGGVVSSIFGIENPALKKARTLEEIQKKIRADNPGLTDKGAYYDIAASYLADAGFENEAMQAQEMANEWRTSQEDRTLKTELTQAQIGNLRSEAEARLLPKEYKPASGVGQLYADLDNAIASNNTAAVTSIKKKIAEEEKGKEVTPDNKVDQLLFDGLVKDSGGDEILAAKRYSRIKVNNAKEINAANKSQDMTKALQLIIENSRVQDKQTSIKTVDSKLYTDNLATQLNETYPDVTEAEQAKMLTDHKTAMKFALRNNMTEDEATAYADKRISDGIQIQKGLVMDSTTYKSTPLSKMPAPAAETPAKSDTGLPPGSKAGKKVMSGPNAGKVEVLDKSGKLIGYADQGTK